MVLLTVSPCFCPWFYCSFSSCFVHGLNRHLFQFIPINKMALNTIHTIALLHSVLNAKLFIFSVVSLEFNCFGKICKTANHVSSTTTLYRVYFFWFHIQFFSGAFVCVAHASLFDKRHKAVFQQKTFSTIVCCENTGRKKCQTHTQKTRQTCLPRRIAAFLCRPHVDHRRTRWHVHSGACDAIRCLLSSSA